MDKLMATAPNVLGFIFSFLPSRDLLNCCLVCRVFKGEVDRQLASVTNVIINGEGSFQTLIPMVLYSSPNFRHFKCQRQLFNPLFHFLSKKCLNLRVLSAYSETLSLDHLLKVSRNLIYFETADVDDINDRRAEELRLLFPSLEALMLRSSASHLSAFCLDIWATQAEGSSKKVAKFIRSTDVCCPHPGHRSTAKNVIPRGITWYSAQNFSTELAKQLKDPSIAASLRILEVHAKNITFDFNLPNLARAKFNLVLCPSPMDILNSLKNSSNLQVLYLNFSATKANIGALGSLVRSFKHLKSFSFIFGTDSSRRPAHLSLPPRLAHLYTDPVPKVDISNVLEARIYFLYTPSACVYKLLNLIGCYKNLRKLDLMFDELESSTILSVVLLLLDRLTKLESIELYARETRVPPFSLELMHYPRLKFLWWKDAERSNKLNIYFDDEYQFVRFESENSFTLRSKSGHSIKVDVPTRTKFHFKFPLELTVTKATFVFPFKWPSFNLPQLLECTVIIEEDEEDIINILATSLLHSPKLKVFTLITELEAQLTLEQVEVLLWSLDKLNHLQRIEGTINLCDYNWPSNLESMVAKFPSLTRVQFNWRFVRDQSPGPQISFSLSGLIKKVISSI